jgi:hypothetical protein
MTLGTTWCNHSSEFRDAMIAIFATTIKARADKAGIILFGFTIRTNVLNLFVHRKYLQFILCFCINLHITDNNLHYFEAFEKFGLQGEANLIYCTSELIGIHR